MRSLIRIVAPLVAVLAIALGGASSALAASPSGSSYSWDLDASWCHDDVVLVYCFDVSGKAQFVANDRRESVVTTQRFQTTIYKDGVQVGESTEVSLDKFSIRPDGTYVQQEVVHTTSVYGDEVCSIQIVWRQAAFETVVDHWSGGCTSA
jgi:hypothetical protein